MRRIKWDRMFDGILLPFVAYIVIGLFIFALTKTTFVASFWIWSITSALCLAMKDIAKNKMITWGICIYVVCVSFLLFRRQDFLQAVCLITSILGMVLLRFLRRYLVAYIILGYVVIAFLIIMTCRGYTFSKVHILLAIFLCFYAISESIFLRESQKKNLNSLLLVYLLVAVLCFWMPVTNQPYGWGFVENITNAIRETIQTVVAELDYQWNKTGNDGIYQIHFSGYSEEETSIRNPLEKRDVEQLFLEGKRTKGNLYLKGNVTNYFTGDSWRDTVKNPTMDISMDALVSMYAIYVYYNAECLRDAKVHYENAQSIQRFFDTYQYQITFRNLKTRSLFYPIKSIQIHADNQQCFGDNIRTTSINQRGYRYAVEFFDLDYQNSILRKILQTAAFVEYDEDLYNGMYEHMEQYFGVKMTKIPFDIFADTISKQEAEIQRIYGNADEVVSESVRQLANVIVANCENDYQKCNALVTFLKRYSYSTQVSIPDGKNVLDWFLFDGMQGYCTHFSTALVQMLRLVGIPARMAEGFFIDDTAEQAYGSYMVTAQHAHAWTEAYITGFGWIRLDATASLQGEETTWYPEKEDVVVEENGSVFDEDMLNQKLEEIEREEKEQELRKEEELQNGILAIKLIVGMLCVLLIMGVVYGVWRNVLLRRSTDPQIIFESIMNILQKRYRNIQPWETLKEYFDGIVSEDDFMKESNGTEMLTKLLEMQCIMEKYWYADIQPTAEDIESMRMLQNSIKESWKKK